MSLTHEQYTRWKKLAETLSDQIQSVAQELEKALKWSDGRQKAENVKKLSANIRKLSEELSRASVSSPASDTFKE